MISERFELILFLVWLSFGSALFCGKFSIGFTDKAIMSGADVSADHGGGGA